jgi:alpha-ketoglutarate-dependent taurine dioxygenase
LGLRFALAERQPQIERLLSESLRMLSRAVRDRAWRADSIDDSASWYYPIPEVCFTLLERTRPLHGPVTALRFTEVEIAPCREALAPLLAVLEEGRGFAILKPGPRSCSSSQEAQLLYWLIGHALGQPFEQNVQGMLLYEVRDYGQDVAQGARFSVTNAESTFHTDNSFGDTVLDYIGLLCLQTARSGGINHLVSGYAIHQILLAEHPGILEVLSGPFHVDRRGGVRPGQAPTAWLPVITAEGAEVTFRYLRYWIEAGHVKAGQPLTTAQVEALNTLDQVAQRPELRVEFRLGPGEMLFLNNRWLLHNRTAFVDHEDPAKRRHLVRLWLQRRST